MIISHIWPKESIIFMFYLPSLVQMIFLLQENLGDIPSQYDPCVLHKKVYFKEQIVAEVPRSSFLPSTAQTVVTGITVFEVPARICGTCSKRCQRISDWIRIGSGVLTVTFLFWVELSRVSTRRVVPFEILNVYFRLDISQWMLMT